ncbi:hypothetical protein WDJ51_11390 [Rathayibacter sp. YIM 133350]|uniref:hypothetical protein n=1 Tax=Rathayibacter sp. YIM 133350 TaxID=3131992 RepID=UPI00307D688F
MDWWIIAAVAAVIALLVLATKRGWIDLSNKTRTGGMGGAVGVLDEVFAPTHHEAAVEQDRQTVLPAPAPLPGDGDKGIAQAEAGDAQPASRFEGRIRLDL